MDDLPIISLSSSEMQVRRKYHLTLSKMFIQQYGINFALLLSELDRITYTCDASADEEGYIQLSYNLFKKDIRLSKEQVKPIIDEMIEIGFVNVRYTHQRRRKLYRINREKITEKLNNLIFLYESKKKN